MGYLAKHEDVASFAEVMQAMGVNLGHIFYIPGLDVHGLRCGPSAVLGEMFEDIHETNIAILESQFPGFKGSVESYENYSRRELYDFACEFIDDLKRNCDLPYLIELKTCQNIHYVNHSEDGEISGYSGAWNATSSVWILAESLEDAMQQGIKIGHENLKRHDAKNNNE